MYHIILALEYNTNWIYSITSLYSLFASYIPYNHSVKRIKQIRHMVLLPCSFEWYHIFHIIMRLEYTRIDYMVLLPCSL